MDRNSVKNIITGLEAQENSKLKPLFIHSGGSKVVLDEFLTLALVENPPKKSGRDSVKT